MKNTPSLTRTPEKILYDSETIASAQRIFEFYISRENRVSFLTEEALKDVVEDCLMASKAFTDAVKQ